VEERRRRLEGDEAVKKEQEEAEVKQKEEMVRLLVWAICHVLFDTHLMAGHISTSG
jgi:hypothetical protein